MIKFINKNTNIIINKNGAKHKKFTLRETPKRI